MSDTKPADMVAVLFQSLRPDEQDAVFARLKELRLLRLAGEGSVMSRFLNGLRRVQEEVEGELSVGDYRAIQPRLMKAGEDIPPIGQVIKHFGSWKRAKSALLMSEDETASKIDARFRLRRVGKVHRYREETLRETLARCAAYVGHVPLVVEFDLWRNRELELAKAQGQDISLPSSGPYRSRYGTWAKALLHFGFSQDEIDVAHEEAQAKALDNVRPYWFRKTEGGV
jgi:HNH endonuclease